MKKLLIISSLLLTGCIPSTDTVSPNEVYEEYNQKVIAGISFEEQKPYYTKRKLAEDEAKMPQYMERMNMSREEVIEFSMDFARSVAQCMDITLNEEKIEGNTATIIYKQKDNCNDGEEGKQKIMMINEDGWKIDSIEIEL